MPTECVQLLWVSTCPQGLKVQAGGQTKPHRSGLREGGGWGGPHPCWGRGERESPFLLLWDTKDRLLRMASPHLRALAVRSILEAMPAWVPGQHKLKSLDVEFLTAAEAALSGGQDRGMTRVFQAFLGLSNSNRNSRVCLVYFSFHNTHLPIFWWASLWYYL